MGEHDGFRGRMAFPLGNRAFGLFFVVVEVCLWLPLPGGIMITGVLPLWAIRCRMPRGDARFDRLRRGGKGRRPIAAATRWRHWPSH